MKACVVYRLLFVVLFVFFTKSYLVASVSSSQEIDIAGADFIEVDSPGNGYTVSSYGLSAGAENVSSLKMHQISNDKLVILDFEDENGWNQQSYSIADTGSSGSGSSFTYISQITPYLSTDSFDSEEIAVSGFTTSWEDTVSVTFKSTYDDNLLTEGGWGIFRAYDAGTIDAGYMVTSGNYGISTVPVKNTGGQNDFFGTLITFSVPVKAAGIAANSGSSIYSSYNPLIRWLDSNGNELAYGNAGVDIGKASFWGLSTESSTIKYMWVGTSSSWPGILTLDDLVFIIPEIEAVSEIDPTGSDSIYYDSLSAHYTFYNAGLNVGADEATSTEIESLDPENLVVLDFEDSNGWAQAANLIADTGSSGSGSSFTYVSQISPYISDDSFASDNVTIAEIKSLCGESVSVTFQSTYNDDVMTEGGWGIFRESDTGSISPGYMVTSGHYGISTPPVKNIDSENKFFGILVTFSIPVKAAGVATNAGSSLYSFYNPLVRWFDPNGTELASGNVGVDRGRCSFWGLSTEIAAIKSMWIGTSSSWPGIITLDDLAFVLPEIRGAQQIDPTGSDSIYYDSLSAYYSFYNQGISVGADNATSSDIQFMDPNNLVVLDFEDSSGWSQKSYSIVDTGSSGSGSSFTYVSQISPYDSSDSMGSKMITIPETDTISGGPVSVTFQSTYNDDVMTEGGWGIYREYDDGSISNGYMAISGNYGISTPPVRNIDSQNKFFGTLITFSVPVKAAGISVNSGSSLYSSYNPLVRWFDEGGIELASSNVGIVNGRSSFWGLSTDTAAVKYMWIGTSNSWPAIITLDDLAFVLPTEKCLDGVWEVSPVQKIDTVSSYANDSYYQAGWASGSFVSDVNDFVVPKNVFYDWTQRDPLWHADVLGEGILDGMNQMYSFAVDCESFYAGYDNLVVWYRRDFTVDSVDSTLKSYLVFDGVAMEAEVFLNGTYVGRHNGSFTGFKLDISNTVQVGSNLVAVRCIIPLSGEELTKWGNSTHYYAGIWRSVSYIQQDGDSVDKILIDPDPLNDQLSYRVYLDNEASASLSLETQILDESCSQVLASSNGSISQGIDNQSFSMSFSGSMWTPDNPVLYKMRIRVSRGGRVVSEKTTTFGFRSIRVSGGELLLNGEPIQMRGYGEDGNFFGGEGYTGSQVKDRYKALIQAYKDTDADCIRWHNQTIPEQNEAADELGFLVYQGWAHSIDMADGMGMTDYLNYIQEYVFERYNHPSIVMWHFANEMWDTDEVLFHDTYTYDVLNVLDTTGRPIIPDSGSYSFPNYSLPGIDSKLDIVDVHSYVGVSFKRLGEPQRRPCTKTREVMLDTIDYDRDVLNDQVIPFMLGECPGQTIWSIFKESYWGTADPEAGDYYREPIGSDGLVRAEIFEEIKEYNNPNFGFGHGLKHNGFINYMGNPGVDAGYLNLWTDIEVVKYCYEQYRLLPTVALMVNRGYPWTDTISDSLTGINRGQMLFTDILPIAGEIPRQLFSGEQRSFTVSIDNKTITTQNNLKLTVRLSDESDNSTLFEGSTITVPLITACSHQDVTAYIIPPSTFTGKAIARLIVHTGDAAYPVSENFYYVSVSPQSYNQSISQSNTLTVWQPANRSISPVLSVLDDLNITYQLATTREVQTGAKKSDWLLIPPCSVYGEDPVYPDPNDIINSEWYTVMLAVRADVEEGMNLLVLEQLGEGDLGIAEGMSYKYRAGNVTADPTVFDHPVLSDVPWDKWWIWEGDDGDITPYVIDTGLTTLATIGAHYDDEVYSIFSEGYLGNGRVIISQPDAVSRWTIDAAATLYIKELLDYTLSGTAWSRIRDWTAIDVVTVTGTDEIDPTGADSLSYDSPSGFYTIYSAGTAAGASSVTSTAMESVSSPQRLVVLDFEPQNGWNQVAYQIKEDQSSASAWGSAFDSGNSISPFETADRIENVCVDGVMDQFGNELFVEFDSVVRDSNDILFDWGGFLQYDIGSLTAGYLVTSGNYGIAGPALNYDGNDNLPTGIMITFSFPVDAAGIVQNVGHPSYGRVHFVKWFDSDGNLLASANVGVAIGGAVFWGLETYVDEYSEPVIKSMWIGDTGTYPPVHLIDDLAFIITE